MNKETKYFVCIVLAMIVILLIYGFADSRGYKAGMLQGAAVNTVKKNKTEQTKAQQAKAKEKEKVLQRKAAAKVTAKEVNTFTVVNPLEGIDLRPDKKMIDTINPFK